MRAAADFEAGYKDTDATAKEVVADPEGQGTMDVPETRNLGLVGEVGQSGKLRDLMKRM